MMMKTPEVILFEKVSVFHTICYALPFNRNFAPRQDLIDKMNKYGFVQPILVIRTSIIDGVERYYVIDGHHRAASAMSINLPFWGIVLENEFKDTVELVEFVASLNNSQNPWHLDDYVRAFSQVGMNEYKKLIVVKSQSVFTFLTLACMLGGTNSRSVVKSIKRGTFKVVRLSETKKTLNYAAELSKYRQMTNRMVLSLHRVMTVESFDKKKFTQAYAKNVEELAKLQLDTFDDTFISWLK